MHHMIVHELRADHQVADELRVDGDGDLQCVFDRAHRGDAVNECTYAADALREGPRVAWIAAP